MRYVENIGLCVSSHFWCVVSHTILTNNVDNNYQTYVKDWRTNVLHDQVAITSRDIEKVTGKMDN